MLKSTAVRVKMVEAETPKSFQVELQPEFMSRSACWRCGRAISNELSILWGVGPDCAASLGLPWEEPPEYRNDYAEENIIKVFLPKSFLSEETQEELRALLPEDQTVKPPVDLKPKAHIAVEDMRLRLRCPWVNERFIAALRDIHGREYHSIDKSNSFDRTEENIVKLVETVNFWGLNPCLDTASQRLYDAAMRNQKLLVQRLEGHGADTLENLKDVNVDATRYDWGLKTIPWQHQAQAILFAATLMGIDVPEVTLND
jgi:hypothetical protein